MKESKSEVYVESNTRFLVQLEKELVLHGLVVDQTGSPVANARISFHYPNGIFSYSQGPSTGPRGTFEIRYGSAFGGRDTRPEDCEVRVFHPAAVRPATAAVNLRTDQFVTLTLELSEDETSLIRGTVTDLDGNVAPGVTVALFEGPGPPVMSATTDQEGNYRLGSVRPGNYSLSASHSSPAILEARRAVTVEASQEYRIDLVVDVGQSVEGRVVSTTGVPLRGAWMECTASSDHAGGTTNFGQFWSTDEEGYFIFTGLKRKFTYKISARHPDYQRTQVELTSPWPKFLEIVLEEGPTLAGVVNDSRGMPLSGGAISIALPGQSDVLRSVSLEGSSGAFRLAGLPSGALELRISLADGRLLTTPIELDSDRRILVLCGDDLRILPMDSD